MRRTATALTLLAVLSASPVLAQAPGVSGPLSQPVQTLGPRLLGALGCSAPTPLQVGNVPYYECAEGGGLDPSVMVTVREAAPGRERVLLLWVRDPTEGNPGFAAAVNAARGLLASLAVENPEPVVAALFTGAPPVQPGRMASVASTSFDRAGSRLVVQVVGSSTGTSTHRLLVHAR